MSKAAKAAWVVTFFGAATLILPVVLQPKVSVWVLPIVFLCAVIALRQVIKK